MKVSQFTLREIRNLQDYLKKLAFQIESRIPDRKQIKDLGITFDTEDDVMSFFGMAVVTEQDVSILCKGVAATTSGDGTKVSGCIDYSVVGYPDTRYDCVACGG